MQLLSAPLAGHQAGGAGNGSAKNSLLSRLLGGTSSARGGAGFGWAPSGGSSFGSLPHHLAVLPVFHAIANATCTTTAVAPSEAGEEVVAPDLGFPRNLQDVYNLGPQLGKGGNGVVRLVMHKETGVEYACKSIRKVLKTGTDKKKSGHIAALKQEIAVLRKLKGSLNIIELEGVYEDDEHVHIITEYCAGGELSFAIGQRHYSERTVASYMRAVLRTLAQCHAHHILHRDIKPGNFMLLSYDERAPLRAIDFGLATPFEPEDLPLTNLGLEGTPWFQAPEVLSSQVTTASDVWAAGIMAYQLLSGRLPFDDHRNPSNASITAIWRSILSDPLDFNRGPWAGISPEAKDFVASLLQRDPAARPSARDALKHPWLVGDSRERSTGKRLQAGVVARIQRFAAASNFKRSVLQMIASDMLQEPGLIPGQGEACMVNECGRPLVYSPAAECLEPLYRSLRFNEAGEASVEAVSAALRDLGFQLSAAEIARLMEQLDPAGTGYVQRSAFAASMVDWRHLQMAHREAWLGLVRRAFGALDGDADGILRRDDVLRVLVARAPGDDQDLAEAVAAAMEEAGEAVAGDQAMDFNDFLAMLRASSLDHLDMYDDRLAHTLGTGASLERLNALLHRGGSCGSGMDSRHGASLRGALGHSSGDDTHHSAATTTASVSDRTPWMQLVGPPDTEMSRHGDPGGGAGSMWRFDVGRTPSDAPPPKAPPPAPSAGDAGRITFRFDVAGHAPPAAAPAAPAWRFDVASAKPSAGLSKADAPAAPGEGVSLWRFDVAPPSPRVDATAAAAAGVSAASAGLFDGRHHGASLYKTLQTSSCRVSERSLHGGMGGRLLEPVLE